MTNRNQIVNAPVTALVANTATSLPWSGNDDKLVLVLQNTGSAATNITIKAGDSIQGLNDLTLSVPVGINLVQLESGRFKNVTGTNKGKIVVISTGTPKVAVVQLP